MTVNHHPTPTDPITPPGAIVYHVYAHSDVGRTREHNEDAFVVADLARGEPLHFDHLRTERASERGALFMVADGMGGAAAGEIASEMAVEVVLQQMRRRWRDGTTVEPVAFVGTLKAATEVANATIHHYAGDHPELRGMGTTATIAGLLGDTLYLAQVGDSRAYLVRDGVAFQITKDQSLMQKLIEAGEITVEEAEMSDRRNIILQALGPEPYVKIDLTHQRVRRDDVLVLCSDGLSGLVKPDQIARAVTEEASPELAAERLVDLANSSGGPDNITVVIARFDGKGLESAAPVDEVGHRVFDSPDLITPMSTSPVVRVESIPEPVEVLPPVETPVKIVERQKRGALYVRVLAAVGIGLTLLFLWQVFMNF
ncbi:MAG TPA: protein phosphatase 2C domain-containing protein [Gemmatimonadaceae bacterium]|nr:protein phosphatase 2C domain-containing protein [Gemmatimonadaceae bacterium]